MTSLKEKSSDSMEFVNDPEKYFREILFPRLESVLGISGISEEKKESLIKSFTAPISGQDSYTPVRGQDSEAL